MKAYSGMELIRLLRQHGWEVVRIEGSHHILSKPGCDEVISVRSMAADLSRSAWYTISSRLLA